MAWKTLYITGRPGFDQEVLQYFEKSGVDFLTGSFNGDGIYLFWITEDFVLDKFKRVIGSRDVFKYRLRFYSTIDAFVEFRDRDKKAHRFTPDQEQMFRDFNNARSGRQKSMTDFFNL